MVSPDELIKKYGADTVRLYTLFIGPPEKDAEWSDRGAEGAYRFLGRLWRLVESAKDFKPERPDKNASAGLRRKTHKTIKSITEDIERDFHFNTAISSIMELVNSTYDALENNADQDSIKEALTSLVLLASPFVPHIAEELWVKLGQRPPLVRSEWPKYDEALMKEESVTIIVQIDGKVRSRIKAPSDITKESLKGLVMADDKVTRWTKDRKIKDFITVPNKLVNIVTE